MNANVSIYQDSVKDSSGILTSESNDIDNIINEYGFIRVRNSVKDKKI